MSSLGGVIGRTVIATILTCGIIVTLFFVSYMIIGILGAVYYSSNKSDEMAKDTSIVVTSIASDHVKDALTECLHYHAEQFPDLDRYCVIDEGSDLTESLLSLDDTEIIIVPQEYECKAEAKGRAMNYFIETVIDEDDKSWYGFIDDDNLILDDTWLYEIPYYDGQGYGAMNPILLPRPGRSLITYVADHLRTSDDYTVFRFFTGILGVPYAGFHGELLCSRGDFLSEITFDRSTIVEDFAYAIELSKRGYKSWQSETKVSILSPHTVRAFFAQRRRWFTGIARYLPKSPIWTKAVVGPRFALWTLGITGNWILYPIWVSPIGLDLPIWLHLTVLSGGLMYALICTVGCLRLGGIKGILLIFTIPICALIEHTTSIYSVLSPRDDFVVIEK